MLIAARVARSCWHLGAYPTVTLASARAARDAAKRLLIDGIDPAEARREDRAQKAASAQTFGLIADEYLEKQRLEGRAAITIAKTEWMLGFARSSLADRAISTVKPADILPILRKLEARRRFHTAHRLRSTIGGVFRYAIATARAEHDPTIALRDALIAYKEKPRPAITDAKRFGGLLRAIDGYEGHVPTRVALKLMALLFPRPGELRKALWKEFDLQGAVWTIPAERMKRRLEHHVSLPRQALSELEVLREITGDGDFVFPNTGRKKQPLSENTLNAALRRLGYDISLTEITRG
jgi:integrase